MPSRRSSLKLGTLHTSAATPKSAASRSAAAITSRRIEPEPSSCTRGGVLPFFVGAWRSEYIPLRMPSSAPAGIAGCA